MTMHISLILYFLEYVRVYMHTCYYMHMLCTGKHIILYDLLAASPKLRELLTESATGDRSSS